MACGLKAPPLTPLIIVALMLAAMGAARAADPTRPPDFADVGAAMPAPDGATDISSGGVPRLQSVVLRKSGAAIAIINGVLLQVNDKVGESTLSEIGPDFVILKGPDGDSQLRLTPAVAKKVDKSTDSAVPAKSAVESKLMKENP